MDITFVTDAECTVIGVPEQKGMMMNVAASTAKAELFYTRTSEQKRFCEALSGSYFQKNLFEYAKHGLVLESNK